MIMDKRFAIVVNGVVENVILIDDQNTDFINSTGAILIPDSMAVSRGWNCSAGVFTYAEYQNIEALKIYKKDEIRAAFDIDSNANITLNGIIWQGGYDKAMRLDAAKRLAELAGQTSTVFYDLTNVGHTLTIAEADAVILAISLAYQTSFARKQAHMIAIDAATTVAEVQAITY